MSSSEKCAAMITKFANDELAEARRRVTAHRIESVPRFGPRRSGSNTLRSVPQVVVCPGFARLNVALSADLRLAFGDPSQ